MLLVINRMTELGGAEGSTALIVDGLHGDGMEFAVVTLHGLTLARRDELEARGVRFYECGPGFPTQLRTVVRAIREFDPDLVHATLFDAELVSCIAGLLCGVPVLRSVVNTPYDEMATAAARSKLRLEVARSVDALLARGATFRFHAISEATRQGAIRRLHVRPDRIIVVPRGRDERALGERTEARRTRTRARIGLTATAPMAFNAARQDPQKGQLLLVEAFARVVDRIPDATLVIAGRFGSETAALQQRVDARGLQDRVMNLGLRDDVADLLCAADVFVFSSLWEGLGGAVIEAMALEVPVVAFAVPAVAEALGDTGVLVPVGDVDALANAVIDLLSDARRRADLARRARVRFDEQFTNTRYLAGMRALYERVIADRAHSR